LEVDHVARTKIPLFDTHGARSDLVMPPRAESLWKEMQEFPSATQRAGRCLRPPASLAGMLASFDSHALRPYLSWAGGCREAGFPGAAGLGWSAGFDV
jgi:hypothetical protein